MTPGTPQFGLGRIAQIAVNVHDLERAVRFYRDTLGMRFLFQVPKMAFFDCGGIRLMLGLPEQPEFDHPASIIYYGVDDIQAAHATLERRGVVFARAPHFLTKLDDRELWLAFFRDPDSNLLGLMSEHAGRPRS